MMTEPSEIAKIVLAKFEEQKQIFCQENDKTDEEVSYHLMYLAALPWLRTVIRGITGCKVLGSGCSRITLALSATRVLKIQYNKFDADYPDFAGQNKAEIDVWENATFSQRRKLAAIFDHGDNWIVMERTRPLETTEEVYEAEELAKLIEDRSVAFQNTGVVNGRVVLHDYGYLEDLNRL